MPPSCLSCQCSFPSSALMLRVPEVVETAPVDNDKDEAGRDAAWDEVLVVLVVLDGVQVLSWRQSFISAAPLRSNFEAGTPHLVARVRHEGREQDGVHPDDEQEERACDEADAKEQQSAIAQRLGLCRVGLLV